MPTRIRAALQLGVLLAGVCVIAAIATGGAFIALSLQLG
jgi:hypothetical protein